MDGRRMLFAVMLGVLIVTGYILTSNEGIGSEEKAVYEEALNMQEQVDDIGFSNFKLADFPVTMYDGKWDFVFYRGEITKRAPVLETFAGTAYPVEGQYEIIIPTLERMGSLQSIVGGVKGVVEGNGYGKEEQIATIWHEAFHAWQLSNFNNTDTTEYGPTEEQIFVKEVDKKTSIRRDVEVEMSLLKNLITGDSIKSENIDELKKGVLEYKELVNERRKKMAENVVRAEQRCELTEGTAYYVESEVLKKEKGNNEYQERYIETLGDFENGRGKYYRSGMAKCLILDCLAPQWKKTLDFTKSLDGLLEEVVKE